MSDNKLVATDQERYPMTKDQPAQIDCRVEDCIFYQGTGKCGNISPALSLNAGGTFVCWSIKKLIHNS